MKKAKKDEKKLVLKKETITDLNKGEMAIIAGGSEGKPTMDGNSCFAASGGSVCDLRVK